MIGHRANHEIPFCSPTRAIYLRQDIMKGWERRRLACFRYNGDAKCAAETRSVSEGTRADCEAIERTSEAKCPQGGANEPRLTVR